MTPLMSLWLPIIVASVAVFIISSLVHMALPWHKGDYPQLPREQEFRDAIRHLALPPGDYMVPRANSMEEMKSEAFQAKYAEGPVVIMTVLPNAWLGMGRSLSLWFVYILVVCFFGAYIAGRALPPGAEYPQVFRFVGASTFLGFAAALWQMTIWYRRGVALTMRSTIDGLIYALVAAGAFGWLWPR